MKRTKRGPDTGKVNYQPTAQERSALGKHFSRRALRTAPRIKVNLNSSKAAVTSVDHPDQAVGWLLLMDALGTADSDFIDGLLQQLANAGREINERELNFMLSVIKSVAPADQLEAMLAAQMAVVHMATMTFARRLANVENIPQQDSAESGRISCSSS
jgi:hypothetical protein